MGAWYGDCRDQLRRSCPSCGVALVKAEVDQEVAGGPTACGAYACGSKFMGCKPGRRKKCPLHLHGFRPNEKNSKPIKVGIFSAYLATAQYFLVVRLRSIDADSEAK